MEPTGAISDVKFTFPRDSQNYDFWDNLTFNSKTARYKDRRVNLRQANFFFVFPDAIKKSHDSRLYGVVVKRVCDYRVAHIAIRIRHLAGSLDTLIDCFSVCDTEVPERHLEDVASILARAINGAAVQGLGKA